MSIARQFQKKEALEKIYSMQEKKGEIYQITDDMKALMARDLVPILQKHKERLAYNAAYQRDLRTIKRLGLNCTVAVYRAGKYGEKK